jgi:hypothetical protein
VLTTHPLNGKIVELLRGFTSLDSIGAWLLWGVFLFIQNLVFTMVSRARNSGSLSRHAKAAVFSNAIYFVNLLYAIKLSEYISGKFGLLAAVALVLFYTAFTLAGSVYAHYRSLKSEKGANAVGYNKKYAQIPVEEWNEMKNNLTLATQILKDRGQVENVPAIAETVSYCVSQIPPAKPGQGMKI